MVGVHDKMIYIHVICQLILVIIIPRIYYVKFFLGSMHFLEGQPRSRIFFKDCWP
jgi:hypothetical protein